MRILMVTLGGLAAGQRALGCVRFLLPSARYLRGRSAASTLDGGLLIARIARSLMAAGGTLVPSARERFPTNLIAIRTLAIAALTVAGMPTATAHLLAFRFAGGLLGARYLPGRLTTAARFLYQHETATALTLVASFHTLVHTAGQQLLARITAGANPFRTGGPCLRSTAGTRPWLTEWAFPTRISVAPELTLVQRTVVRSIANLRTLPPGLEAVHLLALGPTETRLLATVPARWTLTGWVAPLGALVYTAVQLSGALYRAGPRAL
uniref:Putative secreted protein n=1 Tax=Anopheles triannulatus TaxID=58253 RepID=A0A2M4B410_9DIPT